MPNQRKDMLTIRQLIQLKTQGYSHSSIKNSLGISRTTVIEYVRLLESSGFTWEQLNEMDDITLDAILNAKNNIDDRSSRLLNFFPYMEKELKRRGVTRELLWKEYSSDEADPYSYSQFCYHFQQWSRSVSPTAPMEHKGGDKLFIDFSGGKLPVIDPESGEVTEAEVFVATLGASGMTYACAVYSQKQEDVVKCIERCLLFFGGVPAAIVPDNMKAIISRADRYEPQITQLFRQLALHYQTVFLPARSARPRDKGKVENAVKNVYAHVFAPLRNMQFFNIDQLNQAILRQVNQYNAKRFTSRQYCRIELFEKIEKKALKPLPLQPFEIQKHKRAIVQRNGHIFLSEDKHYYSVPYSFIGQRVQIYYTADQVEIYANYQRIAIHQRNRKGYGYSTNKDHLASTHRYILEWNADRYIRWAKEIGEDTSSLIEQIIQTKSHPEQAYKSCEGILHMAKKVGNKRLNDACRRALDYGSYYYKTVKNILERGIDLQQDLFHKSNQTTPDHNNIRGSKYYQ
jgi:transposase